MNNYPFNLQFPFNISAAGNQYLPRTEVTRVNGKAGADARLNLMPTDSSELLLDESAAIIWLAKRDSTGAPTLLPFDYFPHVEKPPVDLEALEQRLSRLEEMYNEKSHTGSSRRKPKPKIPAADDAGSLERAADE